MSVRMLSPETIVSLHQGLLPLAPQPQPGPLFLLQREAACSARQGLLPSEQMGKLRSTETASPHLEANVGVSAEARLWCRWSGLNTSPDVAAKG